MSKFKFAGSALMAAALAGGGLFLGLSARADTNTVGDSAKISGLLNDAKTHAAALKLDSEEMDSFTRSRASWQSFAAKVEQIKEHVNKAGEIVGQLGEIQGEGSPWQQQAITQIPVLLRELAANTQATIEYLNKNQSKVHTPEFKDYVKTNYELSTELNTLISDYVNYGNTKARLEELTKKLEIE